MVNTIWYIFLSVARKDRKGNRTGEGSQWRCCEVRVAVSYLDIWLLINWVVRALNADWLTVVVYQTVYHSYDNTFIFTALMTLVTSFTSKGLVSAGRLS